MSDLAATPSPSAAVAAVAASRRLRQRYLTSLPLNGTGAPFTDLQGRLPGESTGNEGLADLMSSIASIGLLQPILVEALPDGRNRIVAGERRLRACRRLEQLDPANPHIVDGIPSIVAPGPLDEIERRNWQFAENFCRADLAPGEMAMALLFERCGLLVERLADVGVVVPDEIAAFPEPAERFRRMDKLRVESGQHSIGAPWEDVVARLGIQISPARAQRLVRAFQQLPPDLSAEMDEAGVSLHSRSSFVHLHSERERVAEELWDAVRRRHRPELLSGAVAAMRADPDLDPDRAIDTAFDVQEAANEARSLTQKPASNSADEQAERPLAAHSQAALEAIRALNNELAAGAVIAPFVRGSLRMVVTDLVAALDGNSVQEPGDTGHTAGYSQ
ncbi:MAG TPA: ParB N-terminal domain-containing protein [Acidimicrobiales bacterium]|nr:ParB N-terminal domain-containing protein [Acidimicrobiales bacterium]